MFAVPTRMFPRAPLWLSTGLDGDAEADINTLDWQKQQQSSDDLTTCGDPAHLASRLNWISTPPSLSLQPYSQRDLEEYS